jgi:hypothetical protein
MWATLGAHAPTLAVILVISGLLIRYFPQIAAIIFTGDRRRAAFEVLRLKRKDACQDPHLFSSRRPADREASPPQALVQDQGAGHRMTS